MKKAAALRKIEADMLSAKLPLRTNLVVGEGNPESLIMFVGEAPGREEDAQSRPFVGRAGQLLRQCIREAGFKEKDVYITNIVKRRPPENRDPSKKEIQSYAPYLAREIEVVAPRIIVPLGRFAMNYFLPEAKMTRDNGKEFLAHDLRVVPIVHPAAALRSRKMMRAFRLAFAELPGILKNTHRRRGGVHL